jgi:hypothetical protein
MVRRLAVLTVAPVVFVGAVCVAGPAVADTTMACNFTLTAPTVISVSGTPMVTATISPAACTGTANPKSSQVCLTDGGPGPGTCELASGYETAQVYLSPYVPGTSYTAKGTGCAAVATPSAAMCSTVGPKAATL